MWLITSLKYCLWSYICFELYVVNVTFSNKILHFLYVSAKQIVFARECSMHWLNGLTKYTSNQNSWFASCINSLYSRVVRHFGQSPSSAHLSSAHLSSTQVQVWNYGVIKKHKNQLKWNVCTIKKNWKFSKNFKMSVVLCKKIKTYQKTLKLIF